MEIENINDSEVLFRRECRENFSVLPFAVGIPNDFIKARLKKKKTQDVRNPKFAKSIYLILPLYTVVDVPPDGNCLFWSIALAYLITCYGVSPSRENLVVILQKLTGEPVGIQNKFVDFLEVNIENFLKTLNNNLIFDDLSLQLIKHLRNQVVNFMYSHKDYYSGFVAGDFDHYLEKMSLFGTWGGEQEIKALCDLLHCNISVYDKTHHKVIVYTPALNKKAFKAEDLATLYLTFENQNHYSFIFLETNFQRERRENLSYLPFAVVADDCNSLFGGFFEDDREYNFIPRSHVSIFLELMRESSNNFGLSRFINLCQVVCCLSQTIFLLSQSKYQSSADLSRVSPIFYQCIFFLFQLDLSEFDFSKPLAYLGEIVCMLAKQDKFLNHNKPMLINAGAGTHFNLADHFGMTIPFFKKKEAKNDETNQEASQLFRSASI